MIVGILLSICFLVLAHLVVMVCKMVCKWIVKSVVCCLFFAALSHVSPIAAFCWHQSPGCAYLLTSTVGSRAFPVAGSQTWNDLPEDVTSAELLATFHCLLKTHLFRKFFPDYMLESTDCLQWT